MIVYVLIRLFEVFLKILPHRICFFLGRIVGLLAYKVVKNKREVVSSNIQMTTIGRNLSVNAKKELVKDVFVNFSLTIMEIILLSKYKHKWKALLEIDEEIVKKFKHDTQNGAILLISHFNNWEILAVFSSFLGLDILTVGQKIKNPYIDKWIKKSRQDIGVKLASKQGFIDEARKALCNSNLVAFLADQNAGRHGMPMEFLGVEASTFITPALLALRTNKPIVPIFDLRDNKTGKHKIYFADMICPDEFLKQCKNNKKDAILKITQACVSVLETMIQEYPDRWFWFHRRWKR